MTPQPGAAPAAIATQALALRARPSRRQPRHCSPQDDQATSTPTTTDAKWGHFKPSRRGQRKPSFPQPRLNGYGSREDVIGSVLVEHRQETAQGTREIAVTTQHEHFAHASELQTAREALQHLLWGTVDFDRQRPRGQSAAAKAVISRTRDRQVEELAATSETAKMAFEVDGVKKTFEVARHGSAWGAARDADGLVVVIEARNVSPDDVCLRRIGIAELFAEHE